MNTHRCVPFELEVIYTGPSSTQAIMSIHYYVNFSGAVNSHYDRLMTNVTPNVYLLTSVTTVDRHTVTRTIQLCKMSIFVFSLCIPIDKHYSC